MRYTTRHLLTVVVPALVVGAAAVLAVVQLAIEAQIETVSELAERDARSRAESAEDVFQDRMDLLDALAQTAAARTGALERSFRR